MTGKLTKAQVSALKRVERRDWPAGEPRIDWIPRPTATALVRRDLIAPRPGTAGKPFSWSKEIVDLTEAGRAALSAIQKEAG